MTEWTKIDGGVQRTGALNGCTCTEHWWEVPACPGELIEMTPRFMYGLLIDIDCQFHGKGWKFVTEDGCPRWERE